MPAVSCYCYNLLLNNTVDCPVITMDMDKPVNSFSCFVFVVPNNAIPKRVVLKFITVSGSSKLLEEIYMYRK